MSAESDQGESIDFQHVLEFYQSELSDKTQKLALAHGQIKNRDAVIERLRKELREARG